MPATVPQQSCHPHEVVAVAIPMHGVSVGKYWFWVQDTLQAHKAHVLLARTPTVSNGFLAPVDQGSPEIETPSLRLAGYPQRLHGGQAGRQSQPTKSPAAAPAATGG